MKKVVVMNKRVEELLKLSRDELLSKAHELDIEVEGFKGEIAREIAKKESDMQSIASGIVDVLY